MSFLIKKIISLTACFTISILGINEFCTNAAILESTTKTKVINKSYIENINNLDIATTSLNYNYNYSTSDTSDSSVSIKPIVAISSESDSSSNKFTATYENISKDISIYTEISNKDASSKTTPEVIKEVENNTSPPQYKASFTMEATAYTGDTITATGTVPARDPNGLSTISVDPSVIPLGSKVYIPGYGEAIAADTGGAIKGHIIDLFLNTENECKTWGRQNVDLYIVAYPGEW